MSEGKPTPLRADRRQCGEHGRRRVHLRSRPARRRTSPRPSSKREFIKILQSQAYEYLPIKTEADLIANLRTQLEALNGIEFTDAEWERFFKERIAGEREGDRREDRSHPGGLRPAAQARRRHDQEHRADRQDRHPQQPAAGHQPVRGRSGRRRRQVREPLRRDRAGQRLAAGAHRAQAPWRGHPRGVQPDQPLRAGQLLGGLGPVRLRAAVRDQQRHADQVLQQHDAPPAPAGHVAGDEADAEADVELVRVHVLVGGRRQQADPGPDRRSPRRSSPSTRC